MRTIIITLLVSLNICMAKAQELMTLTQNFQNMPAELPSSTTIDSTRLVVYYQYNYPVDNLQEQFRQTDDILCFQIGEKVCKTFSYNLHLMDENITFGKKNKVKFRLNYTPYALFANYPDGCITEENRIPYSPLLQGSTQVVTYSESIPQMEWQLLEQTDSIAGHLCQQAKCNFRGRDWEVWYTMEIPSVFSVWKFSGLPGLILKAKDSTDAYSFEVTEITNKKEPIEVYDWNPIKKSRSEWRKLEKEMYNHPGQFFSKNGEISVFNSATKQQSSAEEWKVLYDPIEQE